MCRPPLLNFFFGAALPTNGRLRRRPRDPKATVAAGGHALGAETMI
jgi:hypothetical protein